MKKANMPIFGDHEGVVGVLKLNIDHLYGSGLYYSLLARSEMRQEVRSAMNNRLLNVVELRFFYNFNHGKWC